jgi:hypothetical protein
MNPETFMDFLKRWKPTKILYRKRTGLVYPQKEISLSFSSYNLEGNLYVLYFSTHISLQVFWEALKDLLPGCTPAVEDHGLGRG